MLNEIGKLLVEYQLKINDCETLLDHKHELIGKNRHEKNLENVAALRKEQAIIRAQKQAYVQAKADIDSLIDYVNTEL